MVLTNIVPGKEAELLIGNNPTSPIQVAWGDSTSAPTRAGTSMVNEITRAAATAYDSTSGVSYIQQVLLSTGSYDTYGEVGRFDDAGTGNMYDRDIFNPLEHTSSVNTRVTMFNSVIADNTNKSVVTDKGVNQVADWFANVAFTGDTHIGFGSYLILDDCDSLGSNPNDWQTGGDATAAVLETTNFKERGAAIRLGKDTTAGVSFNYDRVLAASVDGTNATEFWIWFNPVLVTDYDKLATTDALELQIGSDSSNYKYYRYNKADLIVGWQRKKITIADMTDVSSPNMAAIDYLNIVLKTEVTASTITSGNILMDYWTLTWPLASTETALRQERFNTTATVSVVSNQAVFKDTVTKSEGTSSTINYLGLFDSVSSGNMFSVNEITDTKKSSNTRLIGEVKIQFGF